MLRKLGQMALSVALMLSCAPSAFSADDDDSSESPPDFYVMNSSVNMKRHLPAVRVSMFPKDTNATGKNIFGGVILSHMDTAAGIAARRICASNVVTVTFEKVTFKQPVHIGDILTCWAEVTEIGTSSMHVSILVEVERKNTTIHVTEGSAVFVAVDDAGNPTPIIGWNGKRPRKKKAKTAPVCAGQRDEVAR